MGLRDWFRNQLAALSISVSNVEKNLFNQQGSSLDEDINQERRHTQGMLADSLLHGEVTQEVKNLRWRTYKMLSASTKLKNNFNGFDEEGYPIYSGSTLTPTKQLLKKVKIDNSDNYELEMVFKNIPITMSINEAINQFYTGETISAMNYFSTLKQDQPIKIERKNYPKFDIEKYTKKVNIRHIEGNKKMIEFYLSKYEDELNKTSKLFLKEVKKLISHGPRNIDFIEFDEVGFVSENTLGSDDFLCYGYKILSFDKVIEFDGHYVVKFIAELTINGDDLFEKYVESELEEKYKNKESKKK